MSPNVRKIFTNSTSSLTFCLLQKNDLSSLYNLFMVSYHLTRMSSYAKNKVQMCSVTQHQCRRRQMWVISQIHTVQSLLRTWLCWLNNPFMIRIQLIGISSFAKNKLEMCSVTQHQCRRRQICWKFSQIQPIHSLFICYKKWLVLTKRSIHTLVSTH